MVATILASSRLMMNLGLDEFIIYNTKRKNIFTKKNSRMSIKTPGSSNLLIALKEESNLKSITFPCSTS